MFHTFQVPEVTEKSRRDEESVDRPGPLLPRRISTANACTECRRRKLRCGGSLPCQQCKWYRHPERCNYAFQEPRSAPSKRLAKLQERLDGVNSIVMRLFPGQNVDSLLPKSRDDLIDLAVSLKPTYEPATPLPMSEQSTDSAQSTHTRRSEEANSLAELEQAPQPQSIAQESARRRFATKGVSDDVNALSLSTEQSSSYLGISSINAALKIIFKLAPGVRSYVSQALTPSEVQTRLQSPSSDFFSDEDALALPTPDVALEHIDSYFARVHVLMPMVDEDEFRHTYLYLHRQDSPWLALLNMVLALGSLASGDSSNEEHTIFYKRASKHLTFESFASNSLAMLQALGLLGGYYLHWLNQPNEAHALMGAALRMAIAFGLHREYHTASGSNKAEIPVETRRRTWWSLVCLDTWAAMTTGRPSLGRLGRGITVEVPIVPEQANNAQYLNSLKLLPSSHSVIFCRMATHIQDKLAAQTVLSSHELETLDADLVSWYNDLPPILREDLDPLPTDNPTEARRSQSINAREYRGTKGVLKSKANTCPSLLKTPRAIIYWWYMTLRMLMHRPVLLAVALRTKPYSSFTIEEKEVIDKCRAIAGQAIISIANNCRDELIAGWNAVWLIYQAVMVPLISLWSCAAESRMADQELLAAVHVPKDQIEEWREQVRITIDLLDRMAPYSITGKRTKIVVERLFEANLQPSVLNGILGVLDQLPQAGFQESSFREAPREQPTIGALQTVAPEELNNGMEDIFSFNTGYTGEERNVDLAMAWDDMLWQSDKSDLFGEPLGDLQFPGQRY